MKVQEGWTLANAYGQERMGQARVKPSATAMVPVVGRDKEMDNCILSTYFMMYPMAPLNSGFLEAIDRIGWIPIHADRFKGAHMWS